MLSFSRKVYNYIELRKVIDWEKYYIKVYKRKKKHIFKLSVHFNSLLDIFNSLLENKVKCIKLLLNKFTLEM